MTFCRGLPMKGIVNGLSERKVHMRHTIRIDLKGGRPPGGPILECQTRPISMWLWRMLFGSRHRVVVLMPGNSVDSINVIEQPEVICA